MLLARIYEIPLQQVHVALDGNRLLREEMGREMLTRSEQNLIRIMFETTVTQFGNGGCGPERVLHIY